MADDSTKIIVTAIDHVQLDVVSIEESLSFYAGVMGFEIKEVGIRASVRWMIIGANRSVYLCMHEFPEGQHVKNCGLEITHFGIVVEDFDSVLSTLHSLGVSTVPNLEVQYHSSRSVYFLDPNGYKIEVSEKYGGGLDGFLAGTVIKC